MNFRTARIAGVAVVLLVALAGAWYALDPPFASAAQNGATKQAPI